MRDLNVQSLKATEVSFFDTWLTLMQPFLRLRKQELKVLSRLLYYRYIIQKEFKNEDVLYDLLFNTRTRKKIQEDLQMEDYTFNNLLSALRKKKMIIDNKINHKIIPQTQDDFGNFKLVFNIDIIR